MSSEDNSCLQNAAQNTSNDQPEGEPMCVSEDEENVLVRPNDVKETASRSDLGNGVPLSELRQGYDRWGPPPLPPVNPSPNHTVLYKLPWRQGRIPQPYPATAYDRWDQQHVRMPNSSESLYPVQESDDEKGLRLRWELVQEALLRNILSSHQLESAILSYNSRYNERWNFRALHSLFNEVLEKEETDLFFREVLPPMIRLALQLPELLTGPIPLLRKHICHAITLSQLQIGSILANAFFCTFPRRNSTKRNSEYAAFPDINFNRLFQSGDSDSNSVQEKLKCIINYFRRIGSSAPQGVVTFCRKYLSSSSFPNWSKSRKFLPKLHITSTGYIEDEGCGMLQVDFANKYIGGGVLGWGCVQEEIRFVICPELIVSRLFTECLDSTEALLIVGCERFNRYTGYGHTFEWNGDFRDPSPFDSMGRRHCSIVAMDALYFSNSSSQYDLPNLVREANKAFVGFYEKEDCQGNSLAPVATGNWGCGAFRGDAHLKALVQLIAAAEAGRALVYFTFGDEKLCDRIFGMYRFLVENNVSVGMLWNLLCRYSKKVSTANAVPDLYEFLYSSTRDAIKERELKPATPAKRINPDKISTAQPKYSTSSASNSTSQSSADTNNFLSSEDLDTLIEEFDSDNEMAVDSDIPEHVREPKSIKEAKEISSSSCLSLIEESLRKEELVKKVCKSRKEASSLDQQNISLPPKDGFDESQAAIGETLESNSSGNVTAQSSSCVENGQSSSVGDPEPIGVKCSSSNSNLSSFKRSAAPKRKISDYFNPV